MPRITKTDSRLRPGMNGSMDVVVNRIPNAISVPAKAIFTHQGKPIVYLAEKSRYRPAEVQVLARNPDEVAVSGIPAGAMVTLAEIESAGRNEMTKKLLIGLPAVLMPLALIAWGGLRLAHAVSAAQARAHSAGHHGETGRCHHHGERTRGIAGRQLRDVDALR